MDDRQFDIPVNGITREEYRDSSHQMVLDVVPTGFFMVTVITACILLLMEEVTLMSVLMPYLLLALAFVVGAAYLDAQWKKFPSDVEYSFLIDAEGWQMTVGESYGGSDWNETRKLVEKRHVLLFYQRESNAASSLPKRCLTDEQLTAIRGWYKASRKAYRVRDKELFEAERREKAAKRTGRRRWF